MAVIPLGGFSVIFDAAEEDAKVTIAFDSDDCERDFRSVTERGAAVVEAPQKKPWGVVAAYLRGPGALTVEIEQVLAEEK
jgi:predicted enzyme related to lactoylglutathione lyase